MTLFKPRDYGKFAYPTDEGPTLPRYSISSYAQATKYNLQNQPKPSFYSSSRKYGFDKSTSDNDPISNDVELPIYAGSFMFQDAAIEHHKEALTSYSRKYAEHNKSRESTNESQIKMPVFSDRARYDLFDGQTTSGTLSTDFEIEPLSEQIRRKSNITSYHKAAIEKKKTSVEPLIPIRRYEKEKKLFTLDMNNQNVSGNVNVSKYGVQPSRTREEQIRIKEAEKFANKTKIQRVYPEALLDSSEISIEESAQKKNMDKGGNADQMSFDFEITSSSNAKQPTGKVNREMTIKDGTTFQIPTSTYQQTGDQKPIFSQFKSDVFAKYAERKMNEKNGNKKGSFNFEGSSDDYLLNSSLENADKNVIPTTSMKSNDKPYTSYQNNNQRPNQINPKDDLITKDESHDTKPRYVDTIDIDALLKPRNDDILERLEKFKKEMEESKKMTQNEFNPHSNDFNNRGSDSPLLSESESADTSKAQDDMLSEPSLIFEERPEMF